jgi:hypothetical protein
MSPNDAVQAAERTKYFTDSIRILASYDRVLIAMIGYFTELLNNHEQLLDELSRASLFKPELQPKALMEFGSVQTLQGILSTLRNLRFKEGPWPDQVGEILQGKL